MNNATKQHTLEEAIKTFGESSQITKAIEEMAELMQALCKRNAVRGNDKASLELKAKLLDNICEETADVMIMMEQIAIMAGKGKVEEWKENKLQRLQKRINERKENGN